MRRIFIETPKELPNVQYLSSEDEKYLKKVLRLHLSEEIECFDGKGTLYKGTLTTNQAGNKWGIYLTDSIKVEKGPTTNTLILSLFKLDRMETALEKCSEIGIDKIILTTSEYSQVDLGLAMKKLTRFQTIIQNACRQSERLFIPEIIFCDNTEIIQHLDKDSQLFIGSTEVKSSQLQDEIKNSSNNPLVLWIGPEGGFSSNELGKFNAMGFSNVEIGNSILRSETACIVGAYLMCNR